MKLPELAHRPMSVVRRGIARVQRMPPAPEPRNSNHEKVLQFCCSHGLPQPDATSSGPAVLAVLRMLADPSFADFIMSAPSASGVFSTEATTTRTRANGLKDRSGQLQLPWHAHGDTRPAALIRELGRGWHNRVIDPGHRDFAYDVIVTFVNAGWPIPLYVGDASWMQHTVLVVGASPDSLSVYDPAPGNIQQRSHAAFCSGSLNLDGWQEPWLFILPGDRPGYRFA